MFRLVLPFLLLVAFGCSSKPQPQVQMPPQPQINVQVPKVDFTSPFRQNDRTRQKAARERTVADANQDTFVDPATGRKVRRDKVADAAPNFRGKMYDESDYEREGQTEPAGQAQARRMAKEAQSAGLKVRKVQDKDDPDREYTVIDLRKGVSDEDRRAIREGQQMRERLQSTEEGRELLRNVEATKDYLRQQQGK